MNKTILFKRWLLEMYFEQDNALGDLARETEGDPCWPRSANEHVLRAHLYAHEACERVQELFSEAYALYAVSGLRPETNRTDEDVIRARVRQVLDQPDYDLKESEIWHLLPDEGVDWIGGPWSVLDKAELWMRPKGRVGSVYFIRSGVDGPVKIGFASDPEDRLKTLQTGHPEKLKILAVLPDRTLHDETALHHRFTHLKMRGEWFRPGPDLLKYIEQARGQS